MGTKQLNTCPAPVQLFRTFIRPQHQKPSTPAHVHKMHNQRPPFFGRGWLNDLTMASTQSQSQRRPSQGQADQRGRSPNCHFWHSFVNPAPIATFGTPLSTLPSRQPYSAEIFWRLMTWSKITGAGT